MGDRLMEKEEKIRRARRQVMAITAFYVHLSVFAAVMLILFVVNSTVSSIWWVQWPFLGWGIAVAVHAFIVFGSGLNFLRNWQDRKTHELADKM